MTETRSGQRGANLVEFSVSLSLLLTALLGFIKLDNAIYASNREAAQLAYAANLASQTIERVRLSAVSPAGTDSIGHFTTTYFIQWSADSTSGDTRITATVRWNDAAAEERQLSATTIARAPSLHLALMPAPAAKVLLPE